MTFGGRSLRPWLLLLTAALLFVAECRIFHYPLATGLDALGLFALILVPSYALVWIGARLAGLPLRMACSISDAFVMLNAVLIFFGLYNLQQFHFTPDGGIITRGLFGVDIPWLAGEVHGIRLFGTLRDLHQFACPWQYHDATYRLLALFPRERTLGDLAFAAPLVGYTLLAISVFAFVMRVTAQRAIAWFAVAAWFLVSGWGGLDQSSYALSPSFVFGSVIFLNVLLLLDVRSKHVDSARTRFVLDVAIALLLILLMETKLTSFLVLTASLALLGVIESLRRHWRNGIEFFLVAVIPIVIFALQSRPNSQMPAGDFLIGAPLMGYANHVASLLHVPVSAVSPVTHGLTLEWRSLLIIPYFAFHVGRFVVTDPRILAAIIMLIFVGRKLVTGEHLSRNVAWLLVLILPLGFLLPVLYSPAWYPLALSFYAPLVSTQAAVLIAVPLAFAMLRGTEQVMSDTIEQIAEPIKEGRWDSLLIDDRSGRLPGLIVGGVMRRYAKEHDQPVPPELFLAAGQVYGFGQDDQDLKIQAIQSRLEQIKSTLGDRTLIVTEYIQTGESVGRMAKALQAEGIKFDIASVEADYSAEHQLRKLERRFPGAFDGAQLYVGSSRNGITFYDYTLQAATGVEKVHAEPVVQLIPGQDRSMVVAAREEVAVLQDKLYNKFFS